MTDNRFESLAATAGPVSRETYDRLLQFETRFRAWAVRINLVAPSTLPDLWERHILDSAQILPLAGEAKRFIDLGSGGGFPGLVLAFLVQERGGWVDLVESNRKKAGFLQAMVGEFALPARVHAVRIEDVHLEPGVEIVTSRALAPLPLLLLLTQRWLCAGAVGLFHKGRDYRREIEESADTANLDLIEHRSRIDPDSVVLEVRTSQRAMPLSA